MTTEHFEEIGRDLCRTILIYENIYIPPELEYLYPKQVEGEPPVDLTKLMANEILDNAKLLKAGEGDSSGGSDSEPSEDNLPVEEVAKVVPILEKNQIKKLEKVIKQREEKEKEALKPKPIPPKKKFDESPTRPPPVAR